MITLVDHMLSFGLTTELHLFEAISISDDGMSILANAYNFDTLNYHTLLIHVPTTPTATPILIATFATTRRRRDRAH
ncbi:MAG: hypothetical protein ACYTF7_03650 [Planctomycetota bacterium]|jgi:hypothetical protein